MPLHNSGGIIFTLLKGYDTGWLRLFNLVWEPFLLLAQWLVVGLVTYVVGRALGGVGTPHQNLGRDRTGLRAERAAAVERRAVRFRQQPASCWCGVC
jgi:hypothetical protein